MFIKYFKNMCFIVVAFSFMGNNPGCSERGKPVLINIKWFKYQRVKDYHISVERIVWKMDRDKRVKLKQTQAKKGDIYYVLDFSRFDYKRAKIELARGYTTFLLKSIDYKKGAILIQLLDENFRITEDAQYSNVVVIFRPEDYRKTWQTAIADKNWDKVFDILDEANQFGVQFPEMEQVWFESLYGRGLQRFNEENFAEAITDLQQYLKAKPDDFDATLLIAKTHYKLKEYEKAEEVLKTLSKIKTDKEKLEVYYKLGEVQLATNKFGEAIDNLKRAAQIKGAYDDSEPEIYFLMGLAHYYNKNNFEARKSFTKFLDFKNIDPIHEDKAREFLKIQSEKATEISHVPSAARTQKLRIIYKAVNLRTKPTTSSKILRKVLKGEVYTVLESEGDWLYIQDQKRGINGWIVRAWQGRTFVELLDTELQLMASKSRVPGPRRVKIIYKAVNLRTKPTTSSKILRKVLKGEVYTVLESEGDWLYIQDQKRGINGWVVRAWRDNRFVEWLNSQSEQLNESHYGLSVELKGFNVPDAELSHFAGKIVLLHFWATWCKPCLIELPSLSKFYHKEYPKLREKGLVLLTISNDFRDKDLGKYVEEERLDFPIYFDSLSKINKQLGIQAIPQTLVIAPNGRMLEKLPSQDWQSKELLRHLQSYLNE